MLTTVTSPLRNRDLFWYVLKGNRSEVSHVQWMVVHNLNLKCYEITQCGLKQNFVEFWKLEREFCDLQSRKTVGTTHISLNQWDIRTWFVKPLEHRSKPPQPRGVFYKFFKSSFLSVFTTWSSSFHLPWQKILLLHLKISEVGMKYLTSQLEMASHFLFLDTSEYPLRAECLKLWSLIFHLISCIGNETDKFWLLTFQKYVFFFFSIFFFLLYCLAHSKSHDKP